MEEQRSELEALQSIYGQEMQFIDGKRQIAISIESQNEPLLLSWVYPLDYPKSIPIVSVAAQWLTALDKQILLAELKQLYQPDTTVIYDWIEWLRGNAFHILHLDGRGLVDSSNPRELEGVSQLHDEIPSSVYEVHDAEEGRGEGIDDRFDVFSGEAFVDRKSKFVGHIARVYTREEVDEVLAILKSNKKIRGATHNIVAYRLFSEEQGLDEDFDDDGETGAGEKMLFLVQRLQVVNVVVIVTRWFGGIMLGNDRFKDISNTAKEVLEHHLKLGKLDKVDDKTMKHIKEALIHRKLKALKAKKAVKVHQKFDYIMVLDFEATCDEGSIPSQEIIEFPVVVVNVKERTRQVGFHRYVRPVEQPDLSAFCTQLTGIQQEQVDRASLLPQVLQECEAWLQEGGYLERPNKLIFCTSGDWDLKTQLAGECLRKNIAIPRYLTKWINVKIPFAQQYCDSNLRKGLNLNGMLSRVDLSFEGHPHSGLDDSLNIARLVLKLIEDGYPLQFTATTEP
eukprot:TRINITY_DN6676_c0_g1_i3.p1 TRINITY_DN6676_c0_g1~~TRINITY_DN6676_c0_g1_i3.p1  ORF type:complete len:551 (-),score=114.33 TRINITY_DN6676_c0_g1_i3:772-2298(-)